jgi:hypothetical protein
MSKKLDITVDPVIFEELLKFQDKLPDEATGESKTGSEPAYDYPSGLALLGMKDNRIDTVIPLSMSGGCWDAPNINHNDMYKGMMKAIEKDRIIAGFGFVRHPDWGRNNSEKFDAVMPGHLKYQIHNMRKAFQDITKSIWITLQNDYFRFYRPTGGKDGRIGVCEVKGASLFTVEDKRDAFIKDKFNRDNKIKEAKAKAKAKKK